MKDKDFFEELIEEGYDKGVRCGNGKGNKQRRTLYENHC